MSAARPTARIRRLGRAKPDGPAHVRLAFDVEFADGRHVEAQVRATAFGQIVDLQSEGDRFRAGTTGDPIVDQELARHVADFVSGSRTFSAIAPARREGRR